MARKSVSKAAKKTTGLAAQSARRSSAVAANSSRRATSKQRPIEQKKAAEHEKKKAEAKRKSMRLNNKSKPAQPTQQSSTTTRRTTRAAANTADVTTENRKANTSRMMDGILEAGRRLSRVEQRSDQAEREISASPNRSANSSLRGRKDTEVVVPPSRKNRRPNKKDAVKSAEEQSTQQVSGSGSGAASKRKREAERKKKEEKEEKERVFRENAARDERHARQNAKLHEREDETQRCDAGSDTEEETPAKRVPRVGKNELFDLNMPAGWVHRKTKKEYTGTMRLVKVYNY